MPKADPTSPFLGLKVIDFTSLLPGPLVTMYLADWGAEVLRIEPPDREDLSRQTPPFAGGTSTTHAFLGRSKASTVADLKDPAARAKVAALIRQADIVIEGFRPGVMANFGLDYATLAAGHPGLIYCSLTGYGQTGPYRDRAGHDINYAALSGLAAMTGSRAGGPVLHGAPVCDLAGSFHALFGILTALHHRHQTGKGQSIDVSITDSSLMLSALWAQMQLAAGKGPSWESTLLNGGSFYGYYRTQDGAYVSVGGLEPKFFRGFLEAIDGLDLLRLGPHEAEALRAGIQAKLATRPAAEWLQVFAALDVCVEPVLGFNAIAEQPQVQARGMIVPVPLAGSPGATQPQLASPLKFSTLLPTYRHTGAAKGSTPLA